MSVPVCRTNLLLHQRYIISFLTRKATMKPMLQHMMLSWPWASQYKNMFLDFDQETSVLLLATAAGGDFHRSLLSDRYLGTVTMMLSRSSTVCVQIDLIFNLAESTKERHCFSVLSIAPRLAIIVRSSWVHGVLLDPEDSCRQSISPSLCPSLSWFDEGSEHTFSSE